MTTTDVKKIADLARIDLTADELIGHAKELSNILTYIDQLQEIDTEHIPVTSQVTGLTNVWREDIVSICDARDEILGEATEVEEGGVKVKSVF